MSTELPDNPHDMALWLLSNLGGVARVAESSVWEGTLPEQYDFASFESHLEALPGSLSGPCRADSRTIGFHPASAHVYQDMEELLRVASNRRRVPDRFVVKAQAYAHPPLDDSADAPVVIVSYMEAIRVWAILQDLADVRNGSLLFVSSHDSQLDIRPDFGVADLLGLPDLPRFAAEFGNHETHADQKRSIVRSVLIEQFKPRRSVSLADVLAKFHDIATSARQSLAMYMAEFSVAKVKSEVERQNLDDTLNLNKTLADIQNQLLALPAAILLAGATIVAGQVVRNYAVLGGVVVFCIFVLTLVSNQRHSVDAIATQVARRKSKVRAMPDDSGTKILPLFDALEHRIRKQHCTLAFISIVVLLVVVLTALAVLEINKTFLITEWFWRVWKAAGPSLRTLNFLSL